MAVTKLLLAALDSTAAAQPDGDVALIEQAAVKATQWGRQDVAALLAAETAKRRQQAAAAAAAPAMPALSSGS